MVYAKTRATTGLRSSSTKRYRKRYSGRRKTNYKYYGRIAYDAYRMAKTAVSFINTEVKPFDFDYAAAVTNTGTVQHVTNISRGTAATNRIGTSILAKGLNIHAKVSYNTAANAFQWLRMIILQDMNDNDGTPLTLAQVLKNTDTNYGAVSLYNTDNSTRFKVLYDRTSSVTSVKPIDEFKAYVRFGMTKDRFGQRTIGDHITWDASDVTEKGHIYVLLLSNATTNAPSMTLNSRFTFCDN